MDVGWDKYSINGMTYRTINERRNHKLIISTVINVIIKIIEMVVAQKNVIVQVIYIMGQLEKFNYCYGQYKRELLATILQVNVLLE